MIDVLVAGAGPAGAIAARALALRGARVLMVDRAAFPRPKLCGDTLNPGALRLLDGLGLVGGARQLGVPIAGMIVTGPRTLGARTHVDARYPNGQQGLALSRTVLDAWLVDEAVRAGVRFEPGVIVKGALTHDSPDGVAVRGLVLTDARGISTRVPASVTIGADGRRSAVARSAQIPTRAPRAPRRWAYGASFASPRAAAQEYFGEMHVRHGWYAGIAQLAGGIATVCVVVERPSGIKDPLALMHAHLQRDKDLAGRFGHAQPLSDVTVLGPVANDVASAGVPGLLLAGDAAGFVDPMTGDGVNMAITGAALAAEQAARVLETGDWTGAVERLDAARRAALAHDLRLQKTLRRLTSSKPALAAASLAARVAPSVIRRVVARAGGAA